MTLPQRVTLPPHEQGRYSFLHYVPHSIILNRIIEHLKTQQHASASGREVL